MIGHLVAGLLTIVSALCLLIFSLDGIVKDNCDRIYNIVKQREGRDIILPVLGHGIPIPNNPGGGGGGPYNPGGGGGPYNPGGGGGPYNPGGGGGPYNPGGGGGPYYPGGDGLKRYGGGGFEEIEKRRRENFGTQCNPPQRQLYFQWHFLFGAVNFFSFPQNVSYLISAFYMFPTFHFVFQAFCIFYWNLVHFDWSDGSRRT